MPASAERSRSHDHAMFALVRHLDVVLVIASAPFVVLAKLPVFGYVLAAIGWIAIRFAVDVIKRRAWTSSGTGRQAALHLTAILGRVWMIALVIVVARVVGHTSDGIMAAVVVLIAFTIELAISLMLRDEIVGGRR